jgi:hypothetical protein
MVSQHMPVENLKEVINELSGIIFQKWWPTKIANVTCCILTALFVHVSCTNVSHGFLHVIRQLIVQHLPDLPG